MVDEKFGVSELLPGENIVLCRIKGMQMEHIQQITPAVRDFFVQSTDKIIAFDRWVRLKELYKLNADAVELIFTDARASANSGKSVYEMDQTFTNLNLALINFLSSVRLYLDHTETRIKHVYGDHSSHCNAFKEATHREYVLHFHYRFQSQLRNFVQHCGLPLGHIAQSMRLLEFEGDRIEYTIEIGFSRDLIIGWDGCKANLREELKDGPEYIPLEGMSESICASLERIFESTFRTEISQIRGQGLEILEIIAPAIGTNSAIMMGSYSYNPNEGFEITSVYKDAPIPSLRRLGVLPLVTDQP